MFSHTFPQPRAAALGSWVKQPQEMSRPRRMAAAAAAVKMRSRIETRREPPRTRTPKRIARPQRSSSHGNIVAGMELIRRVKGGKAYGLTFPLIVSSTGEKMGKTAKGAVWLDASRTSPYEYYQYWINASDEDVERFLALFTFLPLEQVRDLTQEGGAALRKAKEVLAFEATQITHGADEAEKAREAARSLFCGQGQDLEALPFTVLDPERLEKGIEAYQLLVEAGLCRTRGEARRLIAQGGVSLQERRIPAFDCLVGLKDFQDRRLLVRVGKKKYHLLKIS